MNIVGRSAEGQGQLSNMEATSSYQVSTSTPGTTPDIDNEDDDNKQVNTTCNTTSQTKHATTNDPKPPRSKRARSSSGQVAHALHELAEVSKQLARPNEEEVSSINLFAQCLNELQQLDGLDENSMINAVTVLKDDKNATAFLTLKGTLRLAWLHSECAKI
jgi:hypothetical protein